MSETGKDLVYGKLGIHPTSRTVYVNDHEVMLTRMEFDVLCFLASNPNMAFTREQIYEAVSIEYNPTEELVGLYFLSLGNWLG